MGRPSNNAERRDQILRAAVRIIARRGFEGASVGDIARAAGLTPGLVHYHFRDKREVLTSLVELLGRAARARITARLERAGSDPRTRVHAFVDAHLALDRDADPDAVACWIEIAAEATRSADVRRRYERFLAEDLSELESLVRTRAVATAILAAIQGYFTLAGIAPGLVPRGSAAASVRRMADGLLDASTRRPRRSRRRRDP
jgi:TetR/AcrR family transcriptional repressor of bet genes